MVKVTEKFAKNPLGKKRIKTIILIIFYLSAGVGTYYSLGYKIPTRSEINWEYPEADQESGFLDYVSYAGNHLSNLIQTNGKYRYQYDFETRRYSLDYSYLRHWGSSYSLIHYYSIEKDPTYLSQFEKSVEWGLRYYKTFKDDPSIGYLQYLSKSNSGGVALAVMSLTQYVKTTNNTKYNSYLEAFGNYLVWAQNKDGRIISYTPKDTSFGVNSSYYEGEALLALVLMYEITQESRYLETIDKAYAWYSKQYNYNENSPFIPWAVSALTQLTMITGNATYSEFAFKMEDFQCQYFERYDSYDEYGNNYKGGIGTRGTISTSSTLEGLADSYAAAVFIEDWTHANYYYLLMKSGIEFVLSLQILREEIEEYDIKYPARVFGGFRYKLIEEDNSTLRNDFTQHVLSAFIKVIKYFPEDFINSLEYR